MFETSSTSKDPLVKVIDFGLAKYFNSSDLELMNTRIGTPYYMAPEVLEGSYDEACDMWSIGVITYCLLAGYPPFNGNTDAQLYRKIKLCDYEFHEEEWSNISDEAKSFVSSLIEPNREKRMKPGQALNHPWLKKNAPSKSLDSSILERLRNT